MFAAKTMICSLCSEQLWNVFCFFLTKLRLLVKTPLSPDLPSGPSFQTFLPDLPSRPSFQTQPQGLDIIRNQGLFSDKAFKIHGNVVQSTPLRGVFDIRNRDKGFLARGIGTPEKLSKYLYRGALKNFEGELFFTL
jgi:hypothetical protein